MKPVLTILLVLVSGEASACLMAASVQSAFFEDLPAPLTVMMAEKATVVAKVTITEQKRDHKAIARVDEVLKGSLPEKTIALFDPDTSTCAARMWVGNSGTVLGNLTPDGMLLLITARNYEIDPVHYPHAYRPKGQLGP
jgi:hypothetical protein